MPENLFERAKQIGLLYVTQWLPNGKRIGNEWSAINPTRDDQHQGSFNINLKTGKWMDGATGDKGGDAVSLYAYLNESKLSAKAREKNYKNIAGGIQAEAAKEILLTYDSLYFPGKNDNFAPAKKTKSDYWSSFNLCFLKKDEKPPSFNPSWYEKNWGKFVKDWDFYKKGKFIFKVARFIDSTGDKSDRPFTLWADGKEKKWRSKRPDGLYPLWNMDELEERQNDNVALWEGQKDADIGKKYIKNYISVGWYQGAGNTNQTDWEPLRGREVWFIFDADLSGRKSIKKIKKIANEFDIVLHLVYPPPEMPKGWSLADELEKGLTEEEFTSILKAKSKKITEKFLDDSPYDFKILGYSGEYITFYPFGSKTVTKHKATTLGKSVLMTLMDRQTWGEFYAKEDGGIAWDAATNDILRVAEKTPVFNPSIVRGSGAWMDDGKLVINTGEKLIIDNQYYELFEAPGSFIYERGLPMPYSIENPANLKDLKIVSDVIKKFHWKGPVHAKLLQGWILLAPFGGALRWRPYIWIAGRAGSGKSWILENTLYPLVGIEFGIMGRGTSTPAGTRNALGNTSKCSIFDEMESDIKKYAEYIEENLRTYREGSSGQGIGAATLHGSPDGAGRQWNVQSMACFASIGAAIKHGADKSRFTILPLDIEQNTSKREKIFNEICTQAKFITRFLGRSIVSRTLLKFDNVMKAIDIIINQIIITTGNKRDADQLGTLLAGAWMFENDEAPTAAQAAEWLSSLNTDILKKSSTIKPDEESCLAEILNGRIEITDGSLRFRVAISAALEYWYLNKTLNPQKIPVDLPVKDLKIIRNELCQIGIKPMENNGQITIRIAEDHPSIRKILRETPWLHIYGEMLSRLNVFIDRKGPDRFAGVPSMFIELNANELFEDIPF